VYVSNLSTCKIIATVLLLHFIYFKLTNKLASSRTQVVGDYHHTITATNKHKLCKRTF